MMQLNISKLQTKNNSINITDILMIYRDNINLFKEFDNKNVNNDPANKFIDKRFANVND